MLLDKDIREPLFEFLEERYGKVRILEEKTVGRSRADVVMVIPEKIVGIEIKSDADTYTRLERQVADYDLYFDANIVVVGSSHASHVAEHVPAHWGIVSVEQQEDHVDFYIVREMQDNPYAQLLRTIRVLWRPELAHIQEKYGLPMYKQKSKDFVRTIIVDRLPIEVVHKEISDALFERDYTAMLGRFRNSVRHRRQNAARLCAKKEKSIEEKSGMPSKAVPAFLA